MAKFWSPFKLNNTKMMNSLMESKPVGLKILTTITTTKNDHMSHSNISIFHWNQILPSAYKYNHPPACFLKSCFLCHKHLSPNKDVYMYRGDQGFCSEECRSRQIYIDDVRQLEISTKNKTIHNNFHRRCHDRHLYHRTRKSMSSPPIFS